MSDRSRYSRTGRSILCLGGVAATLFAAPSTAHAETTKPPDWYEVQVQFSEIYFPDLTDCNAVVLYCDKSDLKGWVWAMNDTAGMAGTAPYNPKPYLTINENKPSAATPEHWGEVDEEKYYEPSSDKLFCPPSSNLSPCAPNSSTGSDTITLRLDRDHAMTVLVKFKDYDLGVDDPICIAQFGRKTSDFGEVPKEGTLTNHEIGMDYNGSGSCKVSFWLRVKPRWSGAPTIGEPERTASTPSMQTAPKRNIPQFMQSEPNDNYMAPQHRP